MTETSPGTLYRILSSTAFQEAVREGAFRGSADDARDGFIHLSTRAQVVETAAKHYAGQADLVLLFVRTQLLTGLSADALRWEPSRGGALFPHLYAALPVTLVHRVERLPLGADGQHVFPQLEA